MPISVQLQQYASSLAAYRVLFYSVFSLGAVAGVVVNALQKHSNFYSMAVYLSKSNGTIVVSEMSWNLVSGTKIRISGHGEFRDTPCVVGWTIASADILRTTKANRSRGKCRFTCPMS